MRVMKLTPVLLAMLLAGTANAYAQLLTNVGDPVRGEQLFREKLCVRCHAADARRAVAPELTRAARRRQPLELAGMIWNHSPEMTAKALQLKIARPTLTGAETGDVLAYLYSLSFVDEPGDAARGRALLKDKQCLTCHNMGNVASGDAPPVNKLARFSSSIAMLDAMWRHAADMQNEMRGQKLRRVTFQGDDMAHLLTYLRTVGPASPQKSAPLSGDAREGAKLFSVKGCNRCHAVYGYGGRIASDLGTRSLPRTPSAIAGLLWNHGSRMRHVMDRYGVPMPTFTPGELMNVVAYLYFLGFNDSAGDVTRGNALFKAKGCARCHGTGTDARPRVGPDLSESQAVLSSMEAARLMWEHAPKMEAQLKKAGMQWPKFERTELADLVAYLASLPKGKSQ